MVWVCHVKSDFPLKAHTYIFWTKSMYLKKTDPSQKKYKDISVTEKEIT
jgi:hypothetical protein